MKTKNKKSFAASTPGLLSNRQGLEMDYRSICENSHVGLYIIQDGRLQYVNPYFCSILGYDQPDELIGKSFPDLVFPSDQERYNLEIQELPEEKDLEIPSEHVFRMIRKNGSAVWVRTDSSRTLVDGKVTYFGHLNDINKFMEVERAYRSFLHRYRKMIEQIEDGLAEVDLKGNITFVNQGGAKILGGSVEAGAGLNYRDYLDRETAEAVFRAYNKVYRTGAPAKFSYEIIRRDGKRRFIEDSITLMRDKTGEITGFRVVTSDIQQRKEAEKELAGHRSLLTAIFGSVNDAVITVDTEVKVLEVNKSTETICGVSIKDISGRKLTRCMNHCRQSCMEVLRQTLNKKITVKEYRTECGHAHRPRQMVSVTSSPLLDAEGHFRGAVLVIRDITLLKDLERELRERHRFHKIIGRSKKMQEIYALLEDLANLETTVLITGESGTGKDMVAKALHYSGQRAFKPLVTVNCSALSESLLESELFGHVKGAFTGAIRDKQGRFQAAQGGTILLDEIGDISPYIQMKLLRVLQEKEFERVGESVTRKADVRVVACTNRALKEKVMKGEFRLDLYYRLKVMEIALPPLRQRLEDLPLLVDYFNQVFNQQFKKNIEGVSNEVLKLFMEYPWPGNIRELEHVLEHAFVLCRGGIIALEHLPIEIRTQNLPAPLSGRGGQTGVSVDLPKILEALEQTHWNKTKAARLLGISRRTLHRKIQDQAFSPKSL
ncbi:MAG: sigma 54-interacting transcriptional regulator [Thermodesulfobacteriota bacterium]